MFRLRLGLGVAAVELAVADDAFRLGADVDEDLVLVDPNDIALDHVTVLEALDVLALLGEELLHGRRLGSEVAHGRRLWFGLDGFHGLDGFGHRRRVLDCRGRGGGRVVACGVCGRINGGAGRDRLVSGLMPRGPRARLGPRLGSGPARRQGPVQLRRPNH